MLDGDSGLAITRIPVVGNLEQPRVAGCAKALEVQRHRLLVEFRRLDGPGWALDAQADQGFGRHGEAANAAWLTVDVGVVVQ